MKISYSKTRKINIGNYETVDINFGIEDEVSEEDFKEKFASIEEFVDAKVKTKTIEALKFYDIKGGRV